METSASASPFRSTRSSSSCHRWKAGRTYESPAPPGPRWLGKCRTINGPRLTPGGPERSHRLGYRWVVAASASPSSQECITMLNAGADYYLDAWLAAPELVARVRVVLRFSAWLDDSYDHGTLGTGALYKDVLTNSS